MFDFEAPAWQQQSACLKVDPEIFFAKRTEYLAKSICKNECPVREECLEWTLKQENNMAFICGVSGGMNPAERRRLVRSRR